MGREDERGITRRQFLKRAAVVIGLALGGREAAERLGLFDKTAVFAEDEAVTNPETRVDIGVPEELLIAGGKAFCFLDGRGSQKEGLFIGSLGGSELVWNEVQLDGMGALVEGALDQCALAKSPNGELFLGMSPEGQLTQIFKSNNNGEGWVLLNGGKPIENFPGLHDLAVDPNNPQRIYAAGGLCSTSGPLWGGLVESLDGGANWHPMFNEFLYGPDSLVVNPVNSDLFVADNTTWGIFKGERQPDGSFAWSKIFECGAPHNLILHPKTQR